MLEPLPDAAPDLAIAFLAELAKMDIQLTREAHDRAMAAADHIKFGELSGACQRMVRSLRQTLAIRDRILRG